MHLGTTFFILLLLLFSFAGGLLYSVHGYYAFKAFRKRKRRLRNKKMALWIGTAENQECVSQVQFFCKLLGLQEMHGIILPLSVIPNLEAHLKIKPQLGPKQVGNYGDYLLLGRILCQEDSSTCHIYLQFFRKNGQRVEYYQGIARTSFGVYLVLRRGLRAFLRKI